jgi:vacuolar-type H+-ATPase subunit I/STV1
MVSQRGMNFTDVYGNNVIDELVENEVLDREVLEEKLSELDELEEDEEPWETLGEVIAEAINDNFYDQNVVESDVTRFDIKRGEIELSATIKTTVGAVLENTPSLAGWEVTVPFLGGTFTL